MSDSLTIVDAAGFDAEEIDHPRFITAECPGCVRTVRFVERQLVKNLRVFNLPLLAVEQGARVYQCPHCEACCTSDRDLADSEVPGATAPSVDAGRITELKESLDRTDDELSLWQLRVELARRKGADELANEARALVDRYEKVASGIRAELSRLRGTSATAVEPIHRGNDVVVVPQAPVPPDPAPEPTLAEVDDEMASLKRTLRKRS